MRLNSTIPVLAAGLLCLPFDLPAQFNKPQVFDFMREFGSTGSHLGVSLRDIDPDRAQVIKFDDSRGVEVMHVEEGSPAEQAGIKTGDVLLSYNGENIVGAQQLGRLVSETPRGRKVKIEYWREGKVSTATATTAPASVRTMAFPTGPDMDLPELPRIAIGSIPSPRLAWRNQRLGIECESLESQLAEFFGVKRGVLILSVFKDSPAAKAGLRAGDVVIKIGDRTVADPRDITAYVTSERRTATSFPLEVTREHKPLAVTINSPQTPQE